MSAGKVLACALLAVTALLLQLTVVDRLHLPVGQPNLVVLVVACAALVGGPRLGMGLGFAAGLLSDLLGDHLIGRLALLFTLLGYGVGQLVPEPGENRPVLVPVAIVAGASAAVSVVNMGIGVLVGDPGIGGGEVIRAAVAIAAYDALLTPFVFPAVRGLLGRVGPPR